MNNVSGKILVVGYSDNVPIRSARFASNYELSLERARSVQKQPVVASHSLSASKPKGGVRSTR